MQQPLQQPPALPPGTLLAGRYLIQGYISGGGFGHIYKAHDTVLGHRRAVKEAFYRDVQTQQQFRLEAEFILNARHPNLVRGYAVFEQAGRFYLVMDYVDGQTVEEIAIQHIRRTGRPLPEAQVLDWVLPICDAAHALHSQPTPIIHRDVKPANIKVTRQGIPVLIDLGLAKLYSQGTQTIGAALAFTPGYAPPEQYQASGRTDQRTDVYGLGATLFFLLTGYQPTEAPARLGSHALPSPRALNPAISPLTEAAVLRAMMLDPLGRQQSAHDLYLELQAARMALAAVTAQAGARSSAPPRRLLSCARCGTANPEAARYCMRCGEPLTGEQAAAVAEGGVRLLRPEAAAALAGEPGHSFADDGLASAQNAPQQAPPAAAAQRPQPLLAATGTAASPLPPAPVAPVVQVAPATPSPAPAPPAPQVAERVQGADQPMRRDEPPATPAPGSTPGQRGTPVRAAGVSKLRGFAYRTSVQLAGDPEEARTVVATILAVVCMSLSFVALLAGWMLIFAAAALSLAGWSWRRNHAGMPAELRAVAPSVLLLGALWPTMWLLIFAFGGWKLLALVWLLAAGTWPSLRVATYYWHERTARRDV
jgi:hypothetical protein